MLLADNEEAVTAPLTERPVVDIREAVRGAVVTALAEAVMALDTRSPDTLIDAPSMDVATETELILTAPAVNAPVVIAETVNDEPEEIPCDVTDPVTDTAFALIKSVTVRLPIDCILEAVNVPAMRSDEAVI